MASVVDYSKFEKIAEEVEREELLKQEEALKAKAEEDGAAAVKKPKKYVDSDGDTVSGASESESSDDDEDEDLHPLFWRKMPKPGSKNEVYAEILKDMVYKNDDDEDKTPNELAEDFKEKGNDFFKWGPKYYKKALKEYKEALQWARKGDGSLENQTCYAAILTNRAAINLKARNFGSVVRDCRAAIKFGPDPLPNCKTHYRAAQACFELGKPKEAKTFVLDALKLDPDNKVLLPLRDKIEKLLAERRKAQMALERAQLEERKLDEAMRKACLARGITMGPLVSDIELYLQSAVGNKTKGGFPRPVQTKDGSMVWSVLLMIPEMMQTDFIQAFDMRQSFRDHLSVMFPATKAECATSDKLAPWDEKADYTLDALEVYFEEREVESYDMTKMWASQYGKRADKIDYSKRLRVRVGLDKTLADAITDAKYVVPGVPSFYVVSTRTTYYSDTFAPQHKDRIRIL